MRTNKTENASKKSAELESTTVPRHNYWTNRRRHSYGSTRVRLL